TTDFLRSICSEEGMRSVTAGRAVAMATVLQQKAAAADRFIFSWCITTNVSHSTQIFSIRREPSFRKGSC
ncbi:hypothetical protein QQF64_006405, partial [Cirrhinus molitorella]